MVLFGDRSGCLPPRQRRLAAYSSRAEGGIRRRSLARRQARFSPRHSRPPARARPDGAAIHRPLPLTASMTLPWRSVVSRRPRILFNGQRKRARPRGRTFRTVAAGPPRPLTPENTWALAVSPDGDMARPSVRASGDLDLAGGGRRPTRPVHGVAARRSARGVERRRRNRSGSSAEAKSRRRVYQHRHRDRPPAALEEAGPARRAGVYSIIEFRSHAHGPLVRLQLHPLLSQLYLVRGAE